MGLDITNYRCRPATTGTTRSYKLGFSWIEIPIEGLTDLKWKEAGMIIRDNDLGVSCTGALGGDRDLINPDPAVRERHGICKSEIDAYSGRRYVCRSILLGGRPNVAANPVGACPRFGSTGGRAQRAESAYAADHGVTLCLEALNRFETSSQPGLPDR
jgi:sugar phosphate isomerase/epimerase